MHDFTVRIEKAAIFRSLENPMTFPFIRERVQKGDMELHGAYFGVAALTAVAISPPNSEPSGSP